MRTEHDELAALVKAWETTKPGDTSVKEIQRWLIEDMKPAIDAAREALASPELNTAAYDDVLAERLRQVGTEDFDASHDDMATAGQLAGAAACYAISDIAHWAAKPAIEKLWPWDKQWWKPTDRRRNLVKAGALILAEIERLDRMTAQP